MQGTPQCIFFWTERLQLEAVRGRVKVNEAIKRGKISNYKSAIHLSAVIKCLVTVYYSRRTDRACSCSAAFSRT